MDTQLLQHQLDRYLAYLQKDSQNIRLLSDVADLYLRMGEFAKAQTFIEKGMQIDPLDPFLLFHQSTVLLSTDQPVQAIEQLNKLLEMGVDNNSVRYNLAYAYFLTMNMESAKATLTPLINAEHNDVPQADLLMARIEHHLGNVNDAFISARIALDKNPNDAQTLGVLALLELDTEKFDEAKKYAQAAVEHDEYNHEALVTLGMVSLDDQEAQQAHEYFDRAVERFPNSGRAWIGRGLGLMLQGNLPDAESVLETGLTHMPEHIGSWHALAWCQIAQGKIQQAKASFLKALDMNRNFAETHGGLAVVSFLEGNSEEAKLHTRRALGLNNKAFSANFANSLLFSKAGDKTQAQDSMVKLMTTPISNNGKTIQQALVKFVSKQNNKVVH